MPIDWLVVSGALISGLLGGAHCVAMCGGIATSISAIQEQHSRTLWFLALQPNIGRVLGYALAGAIVGGLGHALLGLARSPTLTATLRIMVGMVLIVSALRLLDQKGRLSLLSKPGYQLWQWLRPLQRPLLPADSIIKRVTLGMIWAWMPCGLSTTLLAAAWLQASAWQGALTMTAFGLGTLPVMLPLTWSGMRLGKYLQHGGWRLTAVSLLFLSGVLTVSAPWLIHVPILHKALITLGCQSLFP